jgi:hypothetical protein
VKVAEETKSQTMTKADLITIIADKLKFPWARAELLVDVVFGCLEQSMSRGEKVEFVLHAQTIPMPAPLSYPCQCPRQSRLRRLTPDIGHTSASGATRPNGA